MIRTINIIIAILLSFVLTQCSSNFYDDYKEGRFVEENPPPPDTTAPIVVKATAVDSDRIDVEFSEELDTESAETIGNYHIQGINRLEVAEANLQEDGKTVALIIAIQPRERRMKTGMEYTMLVQNVADIAKNALLYNTTTFEGIGWVIAELSDTPSEKTSNLSVEIDVTGADIVAYQYSLDGGPWTEEISSSTPISLTDLSETYHTLKVIAKKSDGEWQEINYATTLGWTVDITAPVAELYNTPENTTEIRSIDISVTGQDISAYRYKIECDNCLFPDEYGESYSVSEVISLSDLEPDNYTISVIGRDSVGNWQADTEATAYDWRIIQENTLVAELFNLPEKITPGNTAEITVSGNRIMYYMYSLDDSPWTELTGVNNILYLENVGEGTHLLKVLGADSSGITQLEEDATQYTWEIDTTPPVLVVEDLLNRPAANTSNQNVYIVVSNPDVSTYKFKIDTGSWSGLCAISTPIEISGLTEGNHTINVIGVDKIGNEQSVSDSAEFEWIIDTTPPVSMLLNTPAVLTNNKTANITVTGDGADTDDVTAYKFKLDNNLWSSEINIATSISLNNIDEKSHKIYVIGKDSAGNWQDILEPTTYFWSIDTTPPDIVLSNLPNESTNIQGIDIQVSGPGATGYKYRITSDLQPAFPLSNWQGDSENGFDISETITIESGDGIYPLADDSYSIEVIARDQAGNWQLEELAETFEWEIDQDIPVAVISGEPDDPTSDTSATFTISGTDIVAYSYRLDSNAWSSEIDISIDISLSGLDDGYHTIFVRGKKDDPAIVWQDINNATDFGWTIDTTPPTADISNLPNPLTSNTFTNISVAGTGVDAYKYKLDNGDWEYGTDPNEGIDGTINIEETGLGDGGHTILVIARDSLYNWQEETDAASYSWTVNTSMLMTELTNTPDNPTSSRSTNITVGPPLFEGYKYRYRDGDLTWYPSETGWYPNAIFTDDPDDEYLLDETIDLSSLADGDIILQVIGKDINGNWQNESAPTLASWTVNANPPTANLVDTPGDPTNMTTISILVSDVERYKYKLNNGLWMDDGDPVNGYPAGTRIEDPLCCDEGYNTLYVLGRSDTGIWQPLSMVTDFIWFVDSEGPTAELFNTPPANTTDTDISVSVYGSGVVSYRWDIIFPDRGETFNDVAWSAEQTDLSIPITNVTALDKEAHILYVIAKDSLGNWQSDADEGDVTMHSWTVSAIESPPTNDTGSTESDLGLRFTWSNPQNTGSVIGIQISTDYDATDDNVFVENIVHGESNLGLVEHYDYIVDPQDGPYYYARVRVEHTDGTDADTWGIPSDGITVVGAITGIVQDTNDPANPIEDANLDIKYMADNSDVTGFSSTPDAQTNASGIFTISNVPIGSNLYKLIAEEGGKYAAKNNITVIAGETTDVGNIILVSGTTPGTVSGRVVDANTGLNIGDASIYILDYNDSVVTDTSSDSGTGVFVTASVPAGTYSILVKQSGFFYLTVDNIFIDDDHGNTETRYALCEILDEPQIRVIVLWGSTPVDLDLHLVGPTYQNETTLGTPNDRFHTYWVNSYKSYNETDGSYIPGTYNATLDREVGDIEGTMATASLVQDDVTSYGPETMNIYRLGAVQYARGIYTYTLHRYSDNGFTWGTNPITMRVYDSQGMVREINFPSTPPDPDLRYWKIFKINIQGSSRSRRTLYVVNQFDNLSLGNKESMDW